MQATYSVTLSDITAFTRFQVRNQPEYRRSRWVSTGLVFFAIPLLSLSFSIVTFGQDSLNVWETPLAAVVGTAAAIWQYASYPRFVAKRVARIYTREPSPSGFGQHTLTIDRNALIVANDYERSELSWNAIVSVAVTDSHLFAFLGPWQAIVVPRATLSGVDFEALAAEVKANSASAA